MKKDGFARIRVDGHIHDLVNVRTFYNNFKHDIEVIVDRLIIGSLDVRRLTESVERALQIGEGVMIVSVQENDELPKDNLFSLKYI